MNADGMAIEVTPEKTLRTRITAKPLFKAPAGVVFRDIAPDRAAISDAGNPMKPATG